MSAWLDARGCLTEAGFAAVSASAVGQVPAELASHLASCARCQQRLLGGGVEQPATKRTPPSLGRMLLFLAAAVLAMLGFFFTLRHLATPP